MEGILTLLTLLTDSTDTSDDAEAPVIADEAYCTHKCYVKCSLCTIFSFLTRYFCSWKFIMFLESREKGKGN